jgi:hypothetical protein
VPVLISTRGQVSAAAHGGARIGTLVASATFNWIAGYSVFEADLTNSEGHQSFDRSFRKFLTPGSQYSVGLVATGQAEVETGEMAEISGWVDPGIVIDPSWDRAHDFSIRFSPGIGTPVPELSTGVLLVAGFALLTGSARKR